MAGSGLTSAAPDAAPASGRWVAWGWCGAARVSLALGRAASSPMHRSATAWMWQEEIIRERAVGEVRCGLVTACSTDACAIARKFGLLPREGELQEVSAETAVAIL